MACAMALCATVQAVEVKRISLEVFPSQAELSEYPIEIGMPFARGVISDAANIRLVRADGAEVPCQVEPLSRYADGSLRAALLVFLSSVSKDRSVTYTVEFGDGISRKAAPAKPVTVSEKRGTVAVDTGLLRFEVGSGRALFYGVSTGDKAILPEGIAPFIQEVAGAGLVFGEQTDVTVEERGPMRAVILVKGRFGAAPDAHGYQTRIHAYAGIGTVRVQHTVIGLDGSKPFELAGWGLRLAASATSAACGVDGTAKELALAKGEGLFQDGAFEYTWGPLSAEERQAREKKRVPFKPGEVPGWRFRMVCTQGEGEPREGRADGWLAANIGGGAVGICVRDFWQQLSADGTRWVSAAGFLAAVPEGVGGQREGHHCVASLAEGGAVYREARHGEDT